MASSPPLYVRCSAQTLLLFSLSAILGFWENQLSDHNVNSFSRGETEEDRLRSVALAFFTDFDIYSQAATNPGVPPTLPPPKPETILAAGEAPTALIPSIVRLGFATDIDLVDPGRACELSPPPPNTFSSISRSSSIGSAFGAGLVERDSRSGMAERVVANALSSGQLGAPEPDPDPDGPDPAWGFFLVGSGGMSPSGGTADGACSGREVGLDGVIAGRARQEE